MIIEVMLAAVLMQQPAPVKNPTRVEFTCQDHDRDDNHEMDIIRTSDGVVIQTIQLGDPAPDANGVIRANVNVQPIAFGEYTARVRAVAGVIRSDNSTDSNLFQRSPGTPAGVVVR